MEPQFLPLRTELTEGIKSSGLTASLWYFLFLQIILSISSQEYHGEPCKFQLRISRYFDGEDRKICPWQVTDQKLRYRHQKHF